MTTRSVAIALSVSGACAALCALLLGQQPEQSRLGESQEEADRNSIGCIACHGQTDSASMHTTGTVRLGCVDCHGGHAGVTPPTGAQKGSAGYDEAKKKRIPNPASLSCGAVPPIRFVPSPNGSRKPRSTSNSSIRAICAWPNKPAAPAAVTPRKCARSAPA